MRIIDHIPHPNITISIFQMNDKYLVKFEAGPMEQVYKFSIDEVKNLDNLKKIVNEEFIEQCRARFNDMFLQLKAATDK
jgi:hypothetical protein